MALNAQVPFHVNNSDAFIIFVGVSMDGEREGLELKGEKIVSWSDCHYREEQFHTDTLVWFHQRKCESQGLMREANQHSAFSCCDSGGTAAKSTVFMMNDRSQC